MALTALMAVLLSLGSTEMASAESMLVQPDGKLVLLGRAWPEAGALARLRSDGSLDQSFGQGGFVIDHRLPGFRALALQPDGRIVGAAVGGIQLARYLTDGTPDPLFSGGGIGGIDEPDQPHFLYADDGPTAIVLPPGGSIIVSGIHNLGGGSGDSWVNRYAADGAFLESVGHVPAPSPASSASVFDLLEEADGSLIGAGSIYDAKELRRRAVLFRFVPGSNPPSYDPSFGNGEGLVLPPSPQKPFATTGFRAVVAEGGGLLAAGRAAGTFLLARFSDDGALDGTFGDGGFVAPPIRGPAADVEVSGSWAGDVAVLPGRRIMVGGGTSEWGDWKYTKSAVFCEECPQPMLAVFDADGKLDPSFGSGGLLRLPKPDGSSFVGQIDQVTPLADGKVLIKGTLPRPLGAAAPFVARLSADGSYDPSFGEGGLTVLDFPCSSSNQAEQRADGCLGSARVRLRLHGLRRGRPALVLRVRAKKPWALLDSAGLVVPRGLRLTKRFRSYFKVVAVGGSNKKGEVHVIRPRNGRRYTALLFQELGNARELRVRLRRGSFKARRGARDRRQIFKVAIGFTLTESGHWAGQETVVRRTR